MGSHTAIGRIGALTVVKNPRAASLLFEGLLSLALMLVYATLAFMVGEATFFFLHAIAYRMTVIFLLVIFLSNMAARLCLTLLS